MIFNSVSYLLFLVIAVVLYWLLTERLKIWMLFLASLTFYGFWRIEFVPLMLVSAINDYFIAIEINKTPQEKRLKKKRLLLFSLFINLSLLFYFKYLFFFTENVSLLGNFFGFNIPYPSFSVILPLGISFYTFQTISYTIDVYRGFLKPEKDFILYGTYVMFFPQLVAGPILRAQEVIDQLKTRLKFDIGFIPEGIKRILYGLFLKTVLADNIAESVDYGFALEAASMSALDVWTLAFLFGFQIYFDFSAYSHIAIGSAKLMGISFPENFNYPYAARSFKVFWKRWHISLSSWIRDYLYLPIIGAKVYDRSTGGIGDFVSLQQTRRSKNKNRALFITWAIMGLWHGANWTFVIWGLYHAILILTERLLQPIRNRSSLLKSPFIGWMFTLPLAMLSWIPFRAQSVEDVFTMYGKIITPNAYLSLNMRENIYLLTAIMFLTTTISYIYYMYIQNVIKKYFYLDMALNTIKYTIVIILVFTFLRPISQFIYFQF